MSAEPEKPALLFDGDCRFCLLWVHYWKHLTGDRVTYSAAPGLTAVEFRRDGSASRGARAVFELLAFAGTRGWLWFYKNIPGFRPASEWTYRVIAAHRRFFYGVSRLLWGKEIRPSRYFLARSIFLKILALVYFIAFFSFGVQAAGLIGSRGILPLGNYLQAAQQQLHAHAYWQVPTVFWINHSDAALTIVALLGIVCSILLLFGIIPRVSLIGLWALYLSFVSAGQVFMQFQWDILLLEAGFLAILVSFTTGAVWLFRWLLFRLMFLSGMVKLLSGDASWRALTALNYHFETQPLPTIFAWYAHWLPEWFHRLSAAGMFAVELVVPFFIFLPRHFRVVAAASIAFLEGAIFLTGNYTFLNILTVGLCIFLLDDELLTRVIPAKIIRAIQTLPRRAMPVFGRSLIAVFIAIIFISSVFQAANLVFGWFPGANAVIADLVSPLHISNTYGLFAVMTRERDEIVIQGSNDGKSWSDYELPYKPGNPARAPGWAQPHQPRLDWQLWFAALDNFQKNPWFVNLMQQILQGSEPVLKLFSGNPFPGTPPRYLRALLYRYRFTTPGERSATGDWWKRDLIGLYFPPVYLQSSRTQ